MMAACPKCGLRTPLLPNGLLVAHAWYPDGRYADGPDDEDGNPTPGEWVGGCGNRQPGGEIPRVEES